MSNQLLVISDDETVKTDTHEDKISATLSHDFLATAKICTTVADEKIKTSNLS